MTDVRALTIRQPWASLIASGRKTVENRTWSTRWRGTLLIHAAKTIDVGSRHAADRLVVSAIVAVADLVDCHFDDGRCTFWSETDVFHWPLADVRPLPKPVPCTGRLGLWTPGGDIVTAVEAQIGALR